MSTAGATLRAPAPPPGVAGRAEGRAPAWRLSDRLGLALCWAIGLLFCAIAAAIVVYLLVQGLRYVSPGLLVTAPRVGFDQSETGGILDPLVGTVIVALLSMAIALPVGVAVGVWLSEFGRPFGLARATESTIEMIAATPSVALALFGTVIFSSPALGFLSRTSGHVVFGRSFLAAGAMLSLIALPLVVATTREGLQAIPAHVREAAYAVGKTRTATIRRVLLPTARPSLVTGSMLGVGRVIGDTAIIVALLGATLNFNQAGGTPILGTLRGTGSTLTSYVYSNAPTGAGNQPTKAYAAAFVLLLIVLLLNLCAELVSRRSRRLTWSD